MTQPGDSTDQRPEPGNDRAEVAGAHGGGADGSGAADAMDGAVGDTAARVEDPAVAAPDADGPASAGTQEADDTQLAGTEPAVVDAATAEDEPPAPGAYEDEPPAPA